MGLEEGTLETTGQMLEVEESMVDVGLLLDYFTIYHY